MDGVALVGLLVGAVAPLGPKAVPSGIVKRLVVTPIVLTETGCGARFLFFSDDPPMGSNGVSMVQNILGDFGPRMHVVCEISNYIRSLGRFYDP